MLTSLALLAVEPLAMILFPIFLIGMIIFWISLNYGTGKWAMIMVGIALFLFCAIIAIFVITFIYIFISS